MAKRVAVVIPTYNGLRWIERCLGSLMETEYEGMTVEVIDNASGDGTAEMVEEKFKQVSVVRLEKNEGFARAVNLGVHRALEGGAEWVMLLNQDARVEKGWLKELMEKSEEAELGIASPVQLNYEGTAVEGEFAKLLAWHGYDVEKLREPVLRTRWVIGAAMMVRARVFRTVGSFDENYFFCGEEMDLCRRAVAAGFKVGVVTRSLVCHQGGTASEDEGEWRRYRRLLGDYIYRLKSPARPLVWLMGTWVCAFLKDFWAGVVHRRRRFLKDLLAVQWAVVRKLPAIWRRRRQERKCPQWLW